LAFVIRINDESYDGVPCPACKKIQVPLLPIIIFEWKNYITRALRFVLLTKCYLGGDIKNNEMGSARGMCGGQERFIQGVDREI
jgi:hypothetical protein